MKRNWKIIMLALTLTIAGTAILKADTIEILITDIVIPPEREARSLVSQFTNASFDNEAGIVTVSFKEKIENIQVCLTHSNLGTIEVVSVDYDFQNSIDIAVPVEEGTYTVTITGTNYKAVGYFHNY